MHGYYVLPAYDVKPGRFKGPRLFTPTDELVAPDLFAFRPEIGLWIEAKHKGAFAWHRKTQTWTTGIDLPLYEHYLRVEAETPWQVWLLFLQEPGQAKDTPPGMVSPTGLYGGPLWWLSQSRNISHTHPDGGPRGMIYWNDKKLRKLASLKKMRTLI